MAMTTSPSQTSPFVQIDDDARPLLSVADRECINCFATQIALQAARSGASINRIQVWRWRLIEEPDWVEVIVYLVVEAAPEAALDFGVDADEIFQACAEQFGPQEHPPLVLRVDWM